LVTKLYHLTDKEKMVDSTCTYLVTYAFHVRQHRHFKIVLHTRWAGQQTVISSVR
jgi:hypothetical protein